MAEELPILQLFKDKRVLVVEDGYFLGDDADIKLRALGAIIVGPVDTVEDALELTEAAAFDAAILDIHLADEFISSVASRLDDLDIPFVFATRYDPAFIRDDHKGFLLCDKPKELAKIAMALWPDPQLAMHPDWGDRLN
jgi:DNA-binding LytR/AlgR family response regulator